MHLSRYPPKLAILVLNLFFGLLCWSVRVLLTWMHGRKGKIVPSIRNPLLLKSATDLAKGIREGKLKSEDVVSAYVQRIQEVEPYINATVECLFKDAVQKAKEVDKLIASGKYTKEQLAEDRPLLGVPISVKNLLGVKGALLTAGSKFFEDFRASEDAPSVSLMKNAGAIVIATTNTPECGLNLESKNLVHGRTRNPYDTSRTSGGSSGGESALIAAGGSVLGIGNDLLGSIRLPCHFTGLFGHKASRGLVSNDGMIPFLGSAVLNFVGTGPMCRYSEDLITSMRVLSAKSEIQFDFDKPVNFKKLKICYMEELQDILATPVEKEILLSMKKAVSYFHTKYGIEVQEVRIPSIKNTHLMSIHLLLSNFTDLKHTVTGGKGDHVNVKLDLLKYFIGKSSFSLTTLLLLIVCNYPLYNKSAVPYYKDMLMKLSKEYDDLLDEDAVLFLPTFPVTAPYHDESFLRFPSIGYTGIFNFLGLPSTQCPLGFSKEGLPYGIQIVGRLNNDPLTIACAVELEKAFGGWLPPEHAR